METNQQELETQLLAELFKVLGDPTRLRIVRHLLQKEMCVTEIADAMDMGQSAISHQLRVLRQARLVTFRKEGKVVWYRLNDDHVVVLISQGLEHVSHQYGLNMRWLYTKCWGYSYKSSHQHSVLH